MQIYIQIDSHIHIMYIIYIIYIIYIYNIHIYNIHIYIYAYTFLNVHKDSGAMEFTVSTKYMTKGCVGAGLSLLLP